MKASFATPLILRLSKDELLCSWFDKLTTSEKGERTRQGAISSQAPEPGAASPETLVPSPELR